MGIFKKTVRKAAMVREDFAKLPRHVAIIMDGNGRWAKRRGMIRSLGHAEGMKAFERLMDHCSDLGSSPTDRRLHLVYFK